MTKTRGRAARRGAHHGEVSTAPSRKRRKKKRSLSRRGGDDVLATEAKVRAGGGNDAADGEAPVRKFFSRRGPPPEWLSTMSRSTAPSSGATVPETLGLFSDERVSTMAQRVASIDAQLRGIPSTTGGESKDSCEALRDLLSRQVLVDKLSAERTGILSLISCDQRARMNEQGFVSKESDSYIADQLLEALGYSFRSNLELEELVSRESLRDFPSAAAIADVIGPSEEGQSQIRRFRKLKPAHQLSVLRRLDFRQVDTLMGKAKNAIKMTTVRGAIAELLENISNHLKAARGKHRGLRRIAHDPLFNFDRIEGVPGMEACINKSGGAVDMLRTANKFSMSFRSANGARTACVVGDVVEAVLVSSRS